MPQDLPAPARPLAGGAGSGKGRELTGRHVLAMFVAFFAVVASVNFYMMRMAIGTMPGLDARNGYDVSQRFNGRIAEAQAQDDRGWKADAMLRNGADGLSIVMEIADARGVPPAGLAVTVRLEHPSTRVFDQLVPLGQDAPGRYSAKVPGRHDGAWTVMIEARSSATGELLYASRNRTIIKG